MQADKPGQGQGMDVAARGAGNGRMMEQMMGGMGGWDGMAGDDGRRHDGRQAAARCRWDRARGLAAKRRPRPPALNRLRALTLILCPLPSRPMPARPSDAKRPSRPRGPASARSAPRRSTSRTTAGSTRRSSPRRMPRPSESASSATSSSAWRGRSRPSCNQYLTFTEPVTLRLAETVYRIDPAESK